VTLHPIMVKWYLVDKPGSREFNVSTSDRITSLDPAVAYDYFSQEIIDQVFDTLIKYEPDTTKLIPGLAEQVPTVANGLVSADGKNYTYVLRAGLTFSDGSALNATVVKRALDRAIRLDDPGGAAFLLYDTGMLGRNKTNANNSRPGAIEVHPDDRTITFHLSAPVAFFNDLMAFWVSAPVPWNYDQTKAQADAVGKVVGSGPYKLTGYVPNQQFVLTRNSLYAPVMSAVYANFGYPQIPIEDKVTINQRSSSTALAQDLQATPKLADIVYRTLTPEDTATLQSQQSTLGIAVKIAASPFIRYLVFNLKAGSSVAIPDVRVRQAIAYSVDRAVIDRDVFAGNVEPLYSMVPPGFSFTSPYSNPVFQTQYGDSKCASAAAIWTQLGFAAAFGSSNLVAREE
jgi:peptide/nickel transport system substrate-binding protein